MDAGILDPLLRAAAFALALAGAAAIVSREPRSAIARLAAAIVGGIAAFVAASAPGIYEAIGPAALVFEIWCVATPAFVWLLAVHLFHDEPPPRWTLLVPAALVLVTLPADDGRFRLGLLAGYPRFSEALFLACRGTAIFLVLAGCALAVRRWRVDLVEQRRRVRAAFVVTFGAAFMVMAGSAFVFRGQGTPRELLLCAHTALILVAFATVVFAARGGLALLAFDAAPARSPLSVVKNDGAEAELAQRIVEAMKTRSLWKRERLSIGGLAEAIGAQEYRVRRAINRHLGYRNFNDFLHDYRLRAAAARLADPSEAHLPVLTIALDCGYGSMGPFNRAFKARYRETPTQYRFRNRRDEATSTG